MAAAFPFIEGTLPPVTDIVCKQTNPFPLGHASLRSGLSFLQQRRLNWLAVRLHQPHSASAKRAKGLTDSWADESVKLVVWD